MAMALFLENPVLQRELVVNLRTPRAFVLMLVYQVALASVVLIAYPRDLRLDLSRESASAQKLVDFFFLGQFVLASLMAPSFAAGAITGEKERKTYEMLLASPLRPSSIVWGKLVAALTHLVVLIIGSLPIIMLCLPLGGVSIYELLAAYFALLVSILLFGALSVLCSSYFKRTSASLVVSYLIILPMVIVGCIAWRVLAGNGSVRLLLSTTILPAFAITCAVVILVVTARRLLYPPDVGSQGNEVVDLEKEQREAVGLVIQRDQFPDKLFAPPRRKTLMHDGANPVYDKEIHAELFSQGTLMLRLVIQISMLLAIPLMAFLLFFRTNLAGWYIGYVVIFNILVAPVFTAGSVSSERERQTLDLLLTTVVSPWQILWGKLVAGFRVSFVLTMFLMWPVLLAFILNPDLQKNWLAVLCFFCIVLTAAIFNSVLALFCSTTFRRTSVAMMSTYLVLMLLYLLPIAIYYLTWSFAEQGDTAEPFKWLGVLSPVMAIGSIPFTETFGQEGRIAATEGNWILVLTYLASTILATALLFGGMILLFKDRWRLTGRG